MTRLHETIRVQRTAEDCFLYLLDFSTTEQWEPGTYRAEKRTPGEPKVGSEFDLVLHGTIRKKAGRTTMSYRLDVIQPPTELTPGILQLTGTGKGFTAVDTISIKSVSATETEIDYVAEFIFRGGAAKAEPLLKGFLNRLGKQAVNGLKTALTVAEEPEPLSVTQKIANKTVLLAAREFTEHGYLGMPNKGLTERMDGKTVVITGPTSGLGLAAACELSRLGARIVLVGRDPSRLAAARDNVIAFSGADSDAFSIIEGDLSLMRSVRKVAEKILAQEPTIDVLINNAGALFNERTETVEGNEQTLAILLLSPYLLTELLMPRLLECGSRIINNSSGGMYMQGLKLSDMQMKNEKYDGAKAYARAKRGLVVATEHWAETHKNSGARFNSMHPGWAETPGVAKALPGFNKTMQGRLRDSRMGADTMVWLASSSTAADQNGKFWFDRQAQPTELLAGTAVSPKKQAGLIEQLNALTGPALQH